MIVRTQSTDSHATEANQTYQNSEWGPAPCEVTAYNSWIPSLGKIAGMTWNALRGVDR
ncbi:hypothetical protein [Xanthomonas phage JGB6]|nr:hypothetical protein [Xanthomonas phage JGB6]